MIELKNAIEEIKQLLINKMIFKMSLILLHGFNIECKLIKVEYKYWKNCNANNLLILLTQ